MTRILITGAGGMLGRDLQAALDGRNVTALTRAELDITDADACRAAVDGHDAVINAAAYTAVDAAEEHEQEARAINALGAENLAKACRDHEAVLVQISTDYVFDGDSATPYDEAAALAPVSAYGRTKAEGETRAQAANPNGTIVVRTAWLYGEHGPNFVRTMLRLYRERGELTVVADQRGQPTWTHDLAHQIVATLDAGVRSAVLHGTNSGETTWHGFASAIIENAHGNTDKVMPTDSAQFVRPARRPANSALSHSNWNTLGIPPMRAWREALDAAMAEGIFDERNDTAGRS